MSEDTNPNNSIVDPVGQEIASIIRQYFPIQNPEDNVMAASILEHIPNMTDTEKQEFLEELRKDIA